jgi:hypothetical protein
VQFNPKSRQSSPVYDITEEEPVLEFYRMCTLGRIVWISNTARAIRSLAQAGNPTFHAAWDRCMAFYTPPYYCVTGQDTCAHKEWTQNEQYELPPQLRGEQR